jgi:hypothetical protein
VGGVTLLRQLWWRFSVKITMALVVMTVSPCARAETSDINFASATSQPLSQTRRKAVVSALISYVKKRAFQHNNVESTYYSAMSLSKSDFVVAYLQGPFLCGTSGCPLLILKPAGLRYKIVGKVIGVHAPIIDMQKTENGLPELGGWVQGGGIYVGREVALSANLKGKYPLSAWMSRKRVSAKSGKVLIPVMERGALLPQ